MFTKSTNYSIFFTLPVLWYLAYTFYKHLNNDLYMSSLDIVDFYIHELWHIFFSIFWNEFLTVAGWTLLQVLIPLLLLIYFWGQRDYFANALCFAWLWTNFFYISMYSGDAIEMKLPLISMWGWEVIHDWFYLFTKMWVIHNTNFISNTFYIFAICLFIFSFLYSISLIINNMRN